MIAREHIAAFASRLIDVDREHKARIGSVADIDLVADLGPVADIGPVALNDQARSLFAEECIFRRYRPSAYNRLCFTISDKLCIFVLLIIM